EPLVAAGNDYRSLRSRPDGPVPSVSVLVPVYNRASLLANVLAGLSRQSFQHPFDVVVIDDGSDEDIGAVVDRFSDAVATRLIRQERDGFGLARARNLGLSAVDTEVVAFLDADCIPGDEWLAQHVVWHRKASNLVVTGSRRHIDVLLEPSMIIDGIANLHDLAEQPDPAIGRYETDDWRGLVYRRSQKLLLGDAGFRAAIGGNSSMRRETILEAGGASTDFRAWGGEDTETAWRMWNAGAFIVPEDRAIIYHQTRHDPPDAEQTRRSARERALPLIADRVPHRFYRKEPSHLYTVPKVSWIITVGDEAEADRAWREASRASYTDTELVLVGDDDAVGNRMSASAASRDVSITGTPAEAVETARGEILAFVDGRARFDRRLLARAMRRFDDSRVGAVRVGYREGGSRLLRLSDLRRIDERSGRSGLPFFGLIRRRELLKDRGALADSGSAWSAGLDRSKIELLVTDLVEIPAGAAADLRRGVPGPSDIRAAGASEIARGVKRALRPTKGNEASAPDSPTPLEERIGIEYVGLAGHKNLGDDAMLEAVRRLMPWADIGTGVTNPRAVMLGGGTLLNSGDYYRNKVRRVDGP
ncbi:MAG: glycosyltransferase, partial [Actinomycetota bacterium]|nr:glycosyltransferase [Actinomycetota bacterium]